MIVGPPNTTDRFRGGTTNLRYPGRRKGELGCDLRPSTSSDIVATHSFQAQLDSGEFFAQALLLFLLAPESIPGPDILLPVIIDSACAWIFVPFAVIVVLVSPIRGNAR